MYYMIYDGSLILHTGCADGVSIGTQYTLMLFDTEAEMLAYINENQLIYTQEVEDEID